LVFMAGAWPSIPFATSTAGSRAGPPRRPAWPRTSIPARPSQWPRLPRRFPRARPSPPPLRSHWRGRCPSFRFLGSLLVQPTPDPRHLLPCSQQHVVQVHRVIGNVVVRGFVARVLHHREQALDL